jgi:hypothetical protein
MAGLESTDVSELYNEAVGRICESVTTFQQRSSGWQFVSVERFNIYVVIYNPLKGKSNIPLPIELSSTKSTINMKNKDDHCFKLCITRALNLIYDTHDHPENVTKILKVQAEN